MKITGNNVFLLKLYLHTLGACLAARSITKCVSLKSGITENVVFRTIRLFECLHTKTSYQL